MSGIYIHVPFCRKACHYCDFHFSTNFQLKEKMLQAMEKEMRWQTNYFSDTIQTIYFGGGTPSVLSAQELTQLLASIQQTFDVSPTAEITLEANPDDLSLEKLTELKSAGINRLSIGIQTFNDEYLVKMNRSHNAKQAVDCVKSAQATGFDNITIDLIYAITEDSWDIWKKDVETALKLNTQHVSAYSLTIEEKTVFGNWAKKGKLELVEDDFSADQFEYLIEELTKNGFDHYEVSNFGKPGFHSLHNTNYWKQVHYLGIGPGAHSFNGTTRHFNIESNPKYIKAINSGHQAYELERLTKEQQINEFVMTSVRTMWGCDLETLQSKFGINLKEIKKEEISVLEKHQLIEKSKDYIKASKKGILQADYIAQTLFL
ncbi:radical SAM family heme chaperone HemW [Flammeovirgaceae bacterium SG7u.111]|nr:radical SAM family heme chaperone HemW [Flammeovirgaceae bacterium SG7u.132]WPO35492.1 radical SAM family heme chaperone HemW [Flammeovirgaceae bacterium SG7u.111]